MVQVIGVTQATPFAWTRFVVSGLGVPCIKKAVQKATKDKLGKILGDFSYVVAKFTQMLISWRFWKR